MIFFVMAVIAFIFVLPTFYLNLKIEHIKNDKPGEEMDKTKYELNIIRPFKLWHVPIIFAIITLLHWIFV